MVSFRGQVFRGKGSAGGRRGRDDGAMGSNTVSHGRIGDERFSDGGFGVGCGVETRDEDPWRESRERGRRRRNATPLGHKHSTTREEQRGREAHQCRQRW